MSEGKKRRGKDTTGAKRQAALRERKERVEALLEPEEFAELQALIDAGECRDKADGIRQSLHEKYLRWKSAKA